MGWFISSKSGVKRETRKLSVDDIWVRCQGCHAHVYKQDFFTNLHVCPKCGWHGKLTAQERINLTLDAGTFKELDASISASDPLSFVDSKGPYSAKVAETRKKTGLNESVVTGTGELHGMSVVLAVMDFRFMGGSLGSGTGEKILRAANHAYANRLPCIVFCASGGARMHEGILSLMQMAKTCAGIARLDERNLPYIAVMTDPTTGGVSASFAMVGDVNLAEPGALVGFAGRRVIEVTIKQKLPDKFQTAEFVLEHGFIDSVVPRKDMKSTLHRILSFYNS
ncbi:MAG: acetyl-CoA carboxylase, carboxyltransferase subunit beta [Chitinispirillaceae bacterium]|jgi:acetyl-CoA carboxylase carboxyl transferase subunit beta|nr:acetyl-CoA carboxylase, carboxyltransferase subunit beta [Chitinispirillaceae bacterium]